MINKISIDKIACFKRPAHLVTDKKVNLIYGLNGTGKSTFSDFLYKPSDSKFMHCSMQGHQDSEILVYNQTFIQEQFYESEDLKGIFTLSKTNKEAEQKIRDTESKKKMLEGEISKRQMEIEKAIRDSENRQQKAKEKILGN